jgi:adenylate cyclase
MAYEIERKFLVKKDVWDNTPKGDGRFYRQGYLLTDPHKTIRVRITDTHGYLTIKGFTTGTTRREYEYKIPRDEAHDLLSNFAVSDLTKLRYIVHHDGKVWEVDEFSGDNEGLVIAEIELLEETEAFSLPDWAGQEVTGDERYYNSSLSLNPYNKWEIDLPVITLAPK